MRGAALAWAGENTRVGEVGRLGHVDDGNRDGGCAAVDYGVEAGFDGRDQVLDRNRGFGLPIQKAAFTPSPINNTRVLGRSSSAAPSTGYEAEPY